LNPLRVSSNYVLIFRRTIVLIQLLVYLLCVSGRPVCQYTGRPLTQSSYTRSCIRTIVLLKMSTELLETCRGFK